MKIAISQSNYLPWQGYFHLVNSVDVFIFLDDVQYTSRDWRNRNIIRGKTGNQWLTLPVSKTSQRNTLINEVLVSKAKWIETHKNQIRHTYRQSINYKDFSKWLFERFEMLSGVEKLSEINQFTIRELANLLGINTVFRNSSEFEKIDNKTERLLSICELLDADTYISGPAAKSYLDVNKFQEKGIEVKWIEYPVISYPQLVSYFDPNVSIIDLIFNSKDYSSFFLKEKLD